METESNAEIIFSYVHFSTLLLFHMLSASNEFRYMHFFILINTLFPLQNRTQVVMFISAIVLPAASGLISLCCSR